MVKILSFGLERTKCVVTQKREDTVPTERNKFNVDEKEIINFLEQEEEGIHSSLYDLLSQSLLQGIYCFSDTVVSKSIHIFCIHGS